MSKKKDSIENLRTKTIGELESMRAEKEEELAKKKLETRVGQNSNVRESRTIRVEIAQINTVINELSQKEVRSEE